MINRDDIEMFGKLEKTSPAAKQVTIKDELMSVSFSTRALLRLEFKPAAEYLKL